jgi:hypothetical protein
MRVSMKLKPHYFVTGLDPAIHGAVVLHLLENFQTRHVSMDARVKPVHDE